MQVGMVSAAQASVSGIAEAAIEKPLWGHDRCLCECLEWPNSCDT